MTESEPASLALHRSGALAARVEQALELLGAPCRVCPRLCSVDRRADERGLCRIGRRAMVASHFPHFGEEDCLRGWNGSGTIFFSGCNLRCVFCRELRRQLEGSGRGGVQRAVGEHDARAPGARLSQHQLGDARARGSQILEALPSALAGGLRLPIVYNTSSYDSPDSLKLMEGVVDVYMPDVKLWTRERARRYLGKREYAEVMRANVKEMHRQVGDLVLDDAGSLAAG